MPMSTPFNLFYYYYNLARQMGLIIQDKEMVKIMKKSWINILSIFVSLILIFPLNVSFVHADESSDDDELLRVEYCSHCGYPVNLVCNGDANHYATGTHTYNLTKTCTVAYLNSRGKWVCSECGRWTWQYNSSGTSLVWHDCWQVHRNCSLGYYKVCTISM